MSAEAVPYQSDEEVTEVLRGFETCEAAPDDFNHRAHLVVVLCYLLRGPEDEALTLMREGLFRFLAHHKIDPSSVYHETLTVFWVRRVLAFVEQSDTTRGLNALANELNEACADSRIVFDYYTKARIESDKARAYWLDSDLKPLDF